ncbi:MAG TPA: fused MFS/spermidine synthase [Limnobacter sp.]|nr:fused MFS/spermidine synthase [Limnobacter sp.]
MDILISEEKGVRQLHFGTEWVQGAMRIAKPHALELEYTREMLLPLAINVNQHWPRTALCIGLGVGALPKFLLKHYPACQVTVVEISPAVLAVAQQHFRLPAQGPNFNVHIGCGADYMATTQRQFDLVLVDGFDEKARVGPLNSVPFYLNVKSCLSPGGFLSVNILSRQKDTEPGKQRLLEAFDGQALILPPCGSGNVIALAHGGEGFDDDLRTLKANAEQLHANTGLNLMNSVVKFHQTLVLQSAA